MSSPFAKFITSAVDVPNDPPHTITIQKLSGRAVERAQAVAAEAVVNGRGFAEKVAKMLAAAKAGSGDAPALAFASDPLNGYDRHTVLINGVTGWSYKDPAFAPDLIIGLDDETCEVVARAILKLTKPELFSDAETERKNA